MLERARDYARQELDLAVRASRLDYNLFTRRIEVRDLVVGSTSAPDPFLAADRVVIELSPAIYRGRLAIERVSLGRPRLNVIRYADGTANLPPSRSDGGDDPLQLGLLSVTALSARLEDRASRQTFTLGPLDLSMNVGGPAGSPGVIGPGGFSVTAGALQTTGTIGGRIAFDGKRLHVEELTTETAEGRLAIDGWADLIADRPAVAVRARAAIDVARAARLAGAQPAGLSGYIDATAAANGELAAPAITLDLTSRDTSYAPVGAVRLSGRASLQGGDAAIENVHVTSALGSLQGQGTVRLGEPPAGTVQPSSRVALRWTDLRIDDLARALGHALPLRSGAAANGSGTIEFTLADVRARGWTTIRVDAATSMRRTTSGTGADHLGLTGTTNLGLDRGAWSLRHSVRAEGAGLDVAGNFTGRLLDGGGSLRSTLDGRTRVIVPDLARLPPLMRSAGVSIPLQVSDGLAGSVLATVTLAGTIDRPVARIDLGARDLKAHVLPLAASVDAQLVVDRESVRAERLHATAGTASLVGSGRYGWRGSVDATFDLSESNLSGLATWVTIPTTVSGSARVQGTIAGTVRDGFRRGQATVSLTARDLLIEQVPVGLLTANGTIPLSEGAVITVVAEAPDIGARANLDIVNRNGYPVSGDIALDNGDVSALVPPGYKDRIGDVAGRLSAIVRGSGLLTEPAAIRGTIDLRSLDLTVRGTKLTLAAPATVVLADDRVAVQSLDLRAGDRIRVTAGGQLGATALADPLRLRLEGPLAELIETGTKVAAVEPVDVQGDGSVTLDVTVGGTLAQPRPNGQLLLQSPSLRYGTLAPVTGLSLEAGIDPTLITLRSAVGRWQGMSLSGQGTLPWRVVLDSIGPPGASNAQPSLLSQWRGSLPAQPARARLTLRADDITEAVLLDLVGPDRLNDVKSAAAASIVLEADRFTLERVDAAVVLERGTLTLAGVPFTQSVPTRLSLRNGRASIDEFRWTAEGNSIVATGGADLTGAEPSIDAGIVGAIDLRALGAFVSGIALAGTAEADLRVTRSLGNLEIVGLVKVADGELQVDEPRLAGSEFEGTLQLAAGRQARVSMTGLINTGNATIEGTLDLANLTAPAGNVRLLARGVALEYPSGFQTESNVDLDLALGAASSTLTGRIDVLEGTYREPIVLTSQLLSLSATSGIAQAAPPSDWLSRLRLNLSVSTANDVRIDNNYGRFDVGATLRVIGTPASPGVLGRLQAAEDGEIFLGGNTYRVERLEIDLANPRGITPEVNFSAQTRIGDIPINIELQCPAGGACERKVTSLATGVDDAEAEARLFGTSGGVTSAGEGLARLLSGEILGVVGRTVGLDAIRLEQGAERRDIFDDPTLISGDVDPATRLTLAKRVGPNVELVFSQNLADDGFTWSTTYVGPYGLSWRLLLLDDESRAYEFRHEIGARTRQPARPRGQRIAGVTISGTPGFPEADLRRQLRLGEGDRFTFGDWQRDRDRLERFYYSQGFLEARIRARRVIGDAGQAPGAGSPAAPPDGSIALEYVVARGPVTHLVVKGVTLPAHVRDRIASRWSSALFDGFLERDARTIVRDHLYRGGHLAATVTTAIARDGASDSKTLTIDVVPGSLVPPRIETLGNAAIATGQLVGLVTSADPLSPWLDPASVERLLEEHYHSEGFLAADVSVSAPELRDGKSVVTVKVTEGPAYSIGGVELSGVPDAPGLDVREELQLTRGGRYRPADVAAGVARIESRLRRAAYRQARTEVVTRVDDEAARVDVAVRVTPGPRSILQDVVVQGGNPEAPAVARSIALATGEPLDSAAIGETRRRLYDLDVYRSVDINVQPVQAAVPPVTDPAREQPVIARITLAERPRYRFRYGLALSDEPIGLDERDRRLGFAADLERRNLFGRGLTAALSTRLRRDQQVGRLTLGARRFFGLPIRSTLFVEREREQLNPDGAFPITSDISSFTGEQAYRVRRSIEFRYGYGIERNHTFIRDQAADPFDLTVTVARFTTSGLVDRRDDPFDPGRGWFTASTLELSTPDLGSDLRFLKNFSQYSRFDPLGARVVLASAGRLGLSRTFEGEVLIPSERFFAGGATSVRGYREDDLGARSIFDDAEGGSALLVLNSELRFRIYKWLNGVGFVDMGNVYPTASDISLGDLQIGLGAGARFDTPFGLFRFDLGVPANRRPFDPRWRIHFGLGHAF